MDELFIGSVDWPPSSVITIKTSDDHEVILQAPILKFRWSLFRADPDRALEVARSLNLEELKAILLFLYSDLPAKRSLSEVFERCGLIQPRSLQESTFVDDMRKLMQDRDSCDFQLISAENEPVFVHRAILSARSRYFRSLFLSHSSESVSGIWKGPRPISTPPLLFFREYLYTGQIGSPDSLQLIPLCWMVRYFKLSIEREVQNILISSLTRELNEQTEPEFAAAAELWGAKCVKEVIEKYRATRR
jgi:hypothetical protein